ncbi:MAG: complex I NDUFA9 subunit family protein [Mariprofundaceae bacterium]
MSKQICIIGGSGFVGQAIVRQAAHAGFQITVACRHPERARALLVEGARLCKVNVTHGKGLKEAVEGSDCVINLVGLLFEKGSNTFEQAHAEGTKRILEACQNAGVSRYIHMSALGAGSVPESAYASTKAEAENYVKDSGLNWTIFRPSIIYGANDSFFNTFKKMTALAPVLPVIAGETRFQPIWVEDVARAFVQSIEMRHANGQSYALAGSKTYSFMQLMQLLMTTLGRCRLLIPVPNFAAKIMASVMQMLPTPPLTSDQLRLLQHDNVVDGESFPAIFGEAANLEDILPSYITGNQAARLQRMLDDHRKSYRQS